jgi:hypothetical protein
VEKVTGGNHVSSSSYDMHVSSSSYDMQTQRVGTLASSGWMRWKRLMLLSKAPICWVEKTLFLSLTRDWISCRKPAPIDEKLQSGNETSVQKKKARLFILIKGNAHSAASWHRVFLSAVVPT